jgi:rhamnose transport system ATP-binding protein
MISSDLPEILGMSDRIAVLREGRLVQTLSAAEASADAVMAAALRDQPALPVFSPH